MKKTGIVLCLVGGLLCLLGVGMIAFYMGKQSNTPAPVVTQAQNTADGQEGSKKTQQDTSAGKDAQDGAADKETGGKDADTKDTEASQADDGETDKQEEDSSKPETEKTNEEKQDTKPQQSTASYTLAAPSVCGQLSVKGTNLVDENGNPVQLRGISTHGLSWFPTFVNQDAFRQFRKEWNVNVMRLAMYTYENGGYCSDGNKEDLKNIVYRGVQYATDNDLYVIIDWHVLQDQNPNKFVEEAKDYFNGMSEKYKDNNNVIYEICNEPNGSTTWQDIKSYAEAVIPVIRANDEDAVILVGTPNWSQRVDEAAKDPLTGYDNIMYTLHFYAATHKDDLRNTMTKAIDGGLPIFVSEFGICDASGNGGLDKDSAQKWVDAMNERNVSYVCWALSNKNESAALIKSSCSKTCQFEESDLTPSGKWLYETLTGNTTGGSTGTGEGGSASGNSADGDVQTFLSSGLEGDLVLKSSWDSDEGMQYQFDMTLTNPSDNAVSSWAIDIHFSSDITLVDGWGGKYTVNGNTLHVISVDYNGKIPGGAVLGDLGFIISGPSGLKVVE